MTHASHYRLVLPTTMGLLLLLSLLPLVVTRGFAISPQNRLRNRRIELNQGAPSLLSEGNHAPHSHFVLQAKGGAKQPHSKNKRALITRRKQSSSSNEAASTPNNSRKKRTIIISIVATAAIALLGYEYRTPLAAAFNKEALQERVLNILHKFHGDWRGIAFYVGGMAIWELLGMSTIPVETAAGMVFGFKVGFMASASGKLLGAFLGFLLGRTLLANFIGEKLENQKTIQLMQNHVDQNPLKVALLMRYSLLPEFVKNCGASLFAPITPLLFIVSVILHGWMYSACWTYVGMDTAKRLEVKGLPIDPVAKFAVLWATIIGMVVTPMLMAWWIRDMQTSELNIVVNDSSDTKKNKKLKRDEKKKS